MLWRFRSVSKAQSAKKTLVLPEDTLFHILPLHVFSLKTHIETHMSKQIDWHKNAIHNKSGSCLRTGKAMDMCKSNLKTLPADEFSQSKLPSLPTLLLCTALHSLNESWFYYDAIITFETARGLSITSQRRSRPPSNSNFCEIAALETSAHAHV
jgi:hypothetical protein